MRAAPWILASFTVSVAACHLVGGTDGLYIDEGSTASGMGGSTPTSSSSSSATSSAGGATSSGQGTGGRPDCVVDADCDASDATTCARPRCISSVCELFYEGNEKTCTENEGNVCDGSGNCVECIFLADCPGENVASCLNNFCIAEGCESDTKDNDETDVDCGGSCAPCPNGKDCFRDADCTSGFCDEEQCKACSGHPDCNGDRYCDPVDQECKNLLPYLSDDCEEGYQCSSGSCCNFFGARWCC